ncbi:MAG: glycosyltransferase [Campylobacterota bacterium]
MKILMITNTYLPHVGGVANSVAGFKTALQKRGHKVLIIAPHFENEEFDSDVLRVEALQNFNGSDFSLSMPSVIFKNRAIDEFNPDIVHSHHPFLLGISALRIARRREIPIVFTHHTLYERYTHYVPFESEVLKKMAKKMAVEYCNLCDGVIAPSKSIKALLEDRGVESPIKVIPTGIEYEKNKENSNKNMEELFDISDETFLIGHVSRLALEKNQFFLAKAVALFLQRNKNAAFAIAGSGDIENDLKDIFTLHEVSNKVYFLGNQNGDNLLAFYKRMDLFVFSSTSETQGMVLAEAMLCSTPVVALDAPAVSEMVCGKNGILVPKEDIEAFSKAIEDIYKLDKESLNSLKQSSYNSATSYSMDYTVDLLIDLYLYTLSNSQTTNSYDITLLDMTLNTLSTEYDIWKSRAQSVSQSKFVLDSIGKIKQFSQNSIKKASKLN